VALTAGTAHRRERLAGLLWPDANEDNARSNLGHALWHIRKAIGPDQSAAPCLLSDELAVSFNAGADYWLDAAVLVRNGESLQDQSDSLAVCRGELLPGFYDDWVTLERERLVALVQHKMCSSCAATPGRWQARSSVPMRSASLPVAATAPPEFGTSPPGANS
jgi:DNA-binding SARP family transcriptional activator